MKAEMEGKIQYGNWGSDLRGHCRNDHRVCIGWLGNCGTNQKISGEAVLASQAAICVAQYVKEPNSQEKFKEYEAVESNKRYEFIEKGGWDKMPGQKEASTGVSGACVAGLDVLIKK
jgi:hypothetical protein